MNFYFIRHGENHSALLKENQYWDPQSSDDLTAKGKVAAIEAAQNSRKLASVTQIISSSLPRARETAETFASIHAHAKISEDPRLNERLPPPNTPALPIAEWNAWQIQSYFQPETSIRGLESCSSHYRRVQSFFQDHFESADLQSTSHNVAVLVISHGGTMEHILRYLFQGQLGQIAHLHIPCDFLHFHHVEVQWGKQGRPFFQLLQLNGAF